MLGKLALFVANRATSGAVDSVARWASWVVIAVFLLLFTLAFAGVAVYGLLEPRFGRVIAASVIAIAALLLALAALSVPAAQDALERRAAAAKAEELGPVESTVAAVKEQTDAAVDYFGPIQVVTAAFLVGLRTGRQVRGKSKNM